MGGEQFQVFISANAKSVENTGDAFRLAQQRARCSYGYEGYTGTIAEKIDYIMREKDMIDWEKLEEFANKDGLDNDKWGPAYCVKVGRENQFIGWMFYGWASS